MQYLVVIEKGDSSFGAYVPDLPGCIAAAETEDEVRVLIREAIEFHIEGSKEDSAPVPLPSSTGTLVEVGAAQQLVRAGASGAGGPLAAPLKPRAVS